MKKTQQFGFTLIVILLGDAAIFLGSLASALYVRHNFTLPAEIWESHRIPFLWLFALWILCLAFGNFYNTRNISINFQRAGKLAAIFVIWAFLSLAFFYFSAFFEIAPKLVFGIHATILYCVFLIWRSVIAKIARFAPVKFGIIGKNESVNELLEEVGKNKNYECMFVTDELEENKLHNIELVIPANEENEKKYADFFFHELFPRRIKVENFSNFFEEAAQKIPVQAIDKRWFLENFDETHRSVYEKMKRMFDVIAAALLVIPVSVIALFIIMALAIEGKTKIFYTQTRLKKGGEKFKIYKFASMLPDAEKTGPQWSSQKNGDPRVTSVGKFIRKFHLDELPQLINIFKGDMSFIGPRPERPEFVEQLEKEIPFYYLRFLVKPGLSGWAQMNYPYGETVEDALHKLQYELYYIKHRSIILDAEIFLRSFALIFSSPAKRKI